MNKLYITKLISLSLLSIVAIIALANPDKVVKIFRDGSIIQRIPASEVSFVEVTDKNQQKTIQIFNGTSVVQEYPVTDIDHIEIADEVATPLNLWLAAEGKNINLQWDEVDGATYTIFRSADGNLFEVLQSDLTEPRYTDTATIAGLNYYKVMATIDGEDSAHSTVMACSLGEKTRGNEFYLGIIGFNDELYYYPINYLSNESAQGFYTFIDGMTTKKSTHMYYALDTSIDYLMAESYPENLADVAIITFTDGLDQGSLDTDKGFAYLEDSEYLSAIKQRLTSVTPGGVNISAYTIGFENNITNKNLFAKNLNDLATSSANVFNSKNMDEVNDAFLKIAGSLSETKYIQKYEFLINGLSNGEKCMFVFDNPTDRTKSKQYILGTFTRYRDADGNIQTSLNDITYVGLTCRSGSSVTPQRVGTKYQFTFDGLQSLDGKKIPTTNLRYWYTTQGLWEEQLGESDLTPEEPEIEKIKRSIVIMLNLDNSSSLDENDAIGKLKTSAKSFVKNLIDGAVDPLEVASITLNKTESSIIHGSGSTLVLSATVLPNTALKKDVIWSSTNPAVATVDENGIVTSHQAGTASIIAKTKDGGYTATCQIRVVSLVQEVVLNHSSLTLYNGESASLSATVHPTDASVKEVTWSSSKPSVATVDTNGNITAIAGGSTTITATAKDGTGKSATCAVTVLQHVNSVSLSNSTLSLNVGTTQQLTATVSPSNASDKTVTWSTSDASIATVSATGLVTAVSKGTATITATSTDGNKSATCQVTITQPVTGITLDKTTLSLFNGDVATLTATVLPSNAHNKEVTWSSSNSAVATVDANGKVTAVAGGSATITATAKDGTGKSATCAVTVLQHVNSVTLSNSTLSLNVGATQQLTATVSPSNASDKTVTWSTSDASIATVSSIGLVTAVSKGSATITATSTDGSKTATCQITVTQPITSITIDNTSVSLNVGESMQLTATILPSNASYKTITWSSSNNEIAIVNSNGILTAIDGGTVIITASSNDGSNVSSSFKIFVNKPGYGNINGYDYVDLGLPSKLKWASYNIGSAKSYDTGLYFAWGETNAKSDYSRDNSKTYGEYGIGDISGNSEYDAARSQWKGTWRLPTGLEIYELITKCSWTWTSKYGVIGYVATGPNGNSIFLPAGGYMDGTSLKENGIAGYYWASETTSDVKSASCFRIQDSVVNDNYKREVLNFGRCDGVLIRPVTK